MKGDSRDAHERRPGDPDAANLVGGGPAVGERPVNEERRRHHVAQEPEPGHDRAERPSLRHDVDELDLEQVSRPRPLDQDRARQRMDGAERQRLEVGRRRARRQESVDRVPRLERDFLAFVDLDDGNDVGMPAVVTGLGLLGQVPLAVDLDAFHLILL